MHPITAPHVDLALELSGRYEVNYHDSLIVAAAHLAGCSLVFSEDLNAGQEYGGVRVENPSWQTHGRPQHASERAPLRLSSRGAAYDAANPMAPTPGTRISPYEIVGALGAGGMAAFTQDAEAVARLRRDAQLLAEGLKRIVASGGVR